MQYVNRYHLDQQGYEKLDDGAMDELAPWLSLAPAVCSGFALAATLAASGLTMFVLAAVGWFAAVTARHPVEWVADRTLRRARRRARPIPPAGAPRRFAYAFAAVWLAWAGLALGVGQTVFGTVLGLVFAAVTGIAAATDFSLGCFLWHQLRRIAVFRRREAVTTWPRVRLREDEL